MIPFLITIEGIAPDEDTMHEMFANVRPDRNKIVEGLTKAGATQITARSTHARKRKVAVEVAVQPTEAARDVVQIVEAGAESARQESAVAARGSGHRAA